MTDRPVAAVARRTPLGAVHDLGQRGISRGSAARQSNTMRHLTAASFLLLAACGGAPATTTVAANGAATDGSSNASGTAAATVAPCPDGAASAAGQADEPDADILALAAATQKCEFSNGSFSWDCPAFKEWRSENDDLFEGPGGNATLLKMLEDTDVRMRTLVVERGFSSGRGYFADKKRAERLLVVIDKERETRLLRYYGKFAAHINGEKLLGKELQGLAKHPTTEFRSSFAEYVLPQNPTTFSLDLTKVLIDDADWAVRRSAVRALSANGRTRPTDKICETLKAQLVRDDKIAEDALEAGSSSKCKGMPQLVLAEIEKRAKDPAKVVAKDAPRLSSPLTSICWRSQTTDDLKKRAFDVAVKVLPKVEDQWQKNMWLSLLRTCDISRAKAALTPYLKDKNKDVAEEAKQELQRVEEELARK
jgi:hypothetical protein